jgi:hypothetical protein
MAELSIFYCEEAFGFLESCSMDDEKYFAALIRMYGRSLEVVSSLPPAERSTYLERLGRLKSRGRNVGWVVEEEFNSPQRVYGRRQVQSLPPSVSQGFPPHRRTRS